MRLQLAKFVARDHRQGWRSVTRVGNTLLNEPAVHEGLVAHLEDEVQEMKDAETPDEESKEAVDVANMAFLVWWRNEASQGGQNRA